MPLAIESVIEYILVLDTMPPQSPSISSPSDTLNHSNTGIAGPVKLVVLQPTTFCNLDCSYCYLPDRHLRHRFSLDLLKPLFRNLFHSSLVREDFTIIWHAGEPLTMPIDFYKAAFEEIDSLSLQHNSEQHSYRHSIQTNGTLLNQSWCDLIKQYNIRVGISLDGPDFIHDAHRRTRAGVGTHASTMRGISHLRENNISFSVIAVLSQLSLDYPDEIFNFFIEHQVTEVGFNIEEVEGHNESSSLERAGTDEKYRSFMQRLYKLTNSAGDRLRIREFESAKQSIFQHERAALGQSTAFSILSVDYQGNFMTFSPELLSLDHEHYGKFILGNVKNDLIESVYQTQKFNQINDDIQAGVELCRQTCEYFSVCDGGAPANKLFENGTFASTETMYCKYHKKILIDIVLDELEQSLI